MIFALHVFNPKDVHLALVPAAAAAAAAAAINAVFFTAYAEAIETILQCFCEDLERNDGSALRAYYMPDSLKQLVLEKIRKPPDEREADEAFSKEVAEERRRRREERRAKKEREAAEAAKAAGRWWDGAASDDDEGGSGGRRRGLFRFIPRLPSRLPSLPSNPFRRR